MEENGNSPKYVVDMECAGNRRRAISAMVSSRKCYQHREADSPEAVMDSDPVEHIEVIAEHCKDTPDFLLPDTPLKEAIFRIMLAARNEASTPAEVSEMLSARWPANPSRDISPEVIGRLLEHSQTYCIVALSEPEPPEEEVVVEVPDIQPAESMETVAEAWEDGANPDAPDSGTDADAEDESPA